MYKFILKLGFEYLLKLARLYSILLVDILFKVEYSFSFEIKFNEHECKYMYASRKRERANILRTQINNE